MNEVKEILRKTLELLDKQERKMSDSLTEEFERKRKIAKDQAALLLAQERQKVAEA